MNTIGASQLEALPAPATAPAQLRTLATALLPALLAPAGVPSVAPAPPAAARLGRCRPPRARPLPPGPGRVSAGWGCCRVGAGLALR